MNNTTFVYQWKSETEKETPINQVTSPANPEALLTDGCRISHNQQEVVLDFSQDDQFKIRVICTPEQTKNLMNQLAQEIAAFEAEHGEIKLPKDRRRKPTFTEELRKNLYRGHRVSKNLTIVNTTRKKRT